MTEKLLAIRKISNRLAFALVILVLLVIGGAFFARYSPEGGVINAPIAACGRHRRRFRRATASSKKHVG